MTPSEAGKPAAGEALHFIHPGPIDAPTGGSLYDKRVIDELRRIGWRVDLHELPGRFPEADAAARDAAAAVLAGLPDSARVIVDGLALPAFEDALPDHAARLRPMALVHHPVSDETGLAPETKRDLRATECGLFENLCRIVVPSPAMARRLADFDVPADRVAVVEPGTDPAPRAQGSAGPTVQLLCVASLTPRKGHVGLIAALADCADLDWRLTCVGPTDHDPETTAAARRLLDETGLAARVTLAGEVRGDALEARYSAADLFVLASFYEGYGMAFAEAMARGLPVIASGGGAVADTVPEAAGMIVPAGDPAALATALRALISDAGLRAVKAAGAYRAGRALPDWPATAARFAAAVRNP